MLLMRTYFHQMSCRMYIRKRLEKVIVLASDYIQQMEKFHSTNGKKSKRGDEGGMVETQPMLLAPCGFSSSWCQLYFWR